LNLIKNNMKQEHREILRILKQYLSSRPHIRFGQALHNLNITQWEEPFDPSGNNVMRDIHEDSDARILKRIKSTKDE